jgi:hypothetical protein
MAIVNVEFDTKEKTLKVSHDGKEMQNVDRVEFWTFGLNGEDTTYFMEVGQREMNEDDGTVKLTRTLANNDIFGNGQTKELSMPERLSRLLFSK